uniref:Kinetochore protein Spc24 n=1 Tax=Clastoptera arizonana TaxID=38151 RepID=A0A1B6DPG9_9HEMI
MVTFSEKLDRKLETLFKLQIMLGEELEKSISQSEDSCVELTNKKEEIINSINLTKQKIQTLEENNNKCKNEWMNKLELDHTCQKLSMQKPSLTDVLILKDISNKCTLYKKFLGFKWHHSILTKDDPVSGIFYSKKNLYLKPFSTNSSSNLTRKLWDEIEISSNYKIR